MPGTDGIKTGYTRASGFNLVSSVVRNNRHLVGVVMGGISVPSRDREMMRILSEGFEFAAKNPTIVAEANLAVARRQAALHQSVQVAAAPRRPPSWLRMSQLASPPRLRPQSPPPAETVSLSMSCPAARNDHAGSPSEPRREITIAIAPTPDLIPGQLIRAGRRDRAIRSRHDRGLKRWAIQIGAFASAPIAEAQLVAYARQAIDIFAFSTALRRSHRRQ